MTTWPRAEPGGPGSFGPGWAELLQPSPRLVQGGQRALWLVEGPPRGARDTAPTSHHWPLHGSAPGSRAGSRAQPAEAMPGAGTLSPTWLPASPGLSGALQLWEGRPAGRALDSLKGREGVVFSYCLCDGLGALVVE